MLILVFNSGSSSQKISLYESDGAIAPKTPRALWDGEIEWSGESATISARKSGGDIKKSRIKVSSHDQAIESLLRTVWSGDDKVVSSPTDIDAVGHRVVHGGARYREPVRITAGVKSAIADAAAFAPLHNRSELAGMQIAQTLLGSVPQVAVFDTGFHRTMPLAATVYPGPYQWFAGGIRRYGFHGINHQYCAGRAAQLAGRKLKSLRLVSCHLGNGCSLAAIRDGQSVDTTMGFTPLEGLMMGTRSGSVDPGILTYLMREHGMSGKALDQLLNHESGLLGISGLSSDMRKILAARAKGHRRATLAFDIYVHRLRAGIAAMTAALGGIDGLIFTAGVGENSAEVRAEACSALKFLGISLNSEKNVRCKPDDDIASSKSAVRVLVIRAQEDWAIAREAWKVVQAGKAQKRVVIKA
jgi:acetate kinase